MKTIVNTLLLILFSTLVYSQSSKEIETIKKNYCHLKEIQPKLQKKSNVEFGYSTEGTEITYYVNKENEILIVEAEFLGETGRSRHEYYFKDNSLFFLLTIEEFYNSPISTLVMSDEELRENGMEKYDSKKSRFAENRYYFNKGKLIRWLDDNQNIISNESKEFKEAEKHHLNFSKEIRDKYSQSK